MKPMKRGKGSLTTGTMPDLGRTPAGDVPRKKKSMNMMDGREKRFTAFHL